MATDSVQKIKDRLSIIDVISPYVELHKAGKNMKGKSPFTNEKTPSFYVSPERGMYYCFSSSQGGDMFTFVEKMEGVDFKGALKILAEKAGVELIPEDPKKRSERDTQYSILEEATRFFQSELTKNEEASGYLKKRGVKTETIAKWRIGYVPGPPKSGWRHTREHLLQKGFNDSELIRAGLVKAAQDDKAPYDVFRDRVMFPIMDPSGRVVGFSGRVLHKDSDAPKYVNSPETELFNKSEILFGYDKAKEGIRHYNFSLIVEGQFDVVLSHQAGYTNAVAVSGTALTAHHISLLQRLSNRVVLALDSDRAGIAAVKRAAELMLSRGIDLKVAKLTGGKDPADIALKDPKELKRLIGRATHVIEFLLDILKEEAKDERAYKLRVGEEVLPHLLYIESQIDRDHFVGVVAKALNTTAEAIRLDLARLESKKNKEVKTDTKDSASTEIGKDVLRRKEGLLAYLSVAIDFVNGADRDKLSLEFNNVVKASRETVRTKLGPEKESELVFTIEQSALEESARQFLADISEKLRELHMLILREEMAKEKNALVSMEQSGDEKSINECINSIKELQRKMSEISIV